ncbi:YjeF-related protein [Cordyceps militaris CM01]|uniref:Enhancer of mRNA-decapping protein 3 n=2 Tax=Cordyceps militaris TaxID=73501 RepID=G3JM87_CORMM|nr:YjeF-related protein [Cordyceps militaris CM01]ATY62187.1 YjeF-related protein [Cordyceps militaris]EGX90811.1 YjeF-related protein [Cordyceps militaris CM01]
MANEFIGLQMRVILRDPPGYQLIGTVRNVEAGSSLSLTNVFIVATQEHIPEMHIKAHNITDLSQLPKQQQPPQQPQQQPPPPVSDTSTPTQSTEHATQTTSPTKSNFVDPAILSMGRRPDSGPPSGSVPVKAPAHTLDPGKPYPVLAPEEAVVPEVQSKGDLDRLFKSMNAPQAQESKKVPTASEATPQKRKARKRTSRQLKQPDHDDEGAAILPGNHGKGWRQTPILQSTSSFQLFKTLKKNGKTDNGWASEDVTEELPEFDFENNLAKFDKRTLFDQMRKEDVVDEADRLVSHNRKPQPGTAGGKNLHYTENVLDLPASTKNADYWNSEAEVGGVHENETLSGRELKGGQAGRRADSKSGPSRRSQSRKASAAMGGQPLSRVNSSVRQPVPSRRSSPRSGYRSAEVQPPKVQQPGLYLVPSNRRVEAISTLQMLNLENIAANEVGFPESLMAENAGRGIAEVAVKALSDPALKVRYEMAGAALSQTANVSLPINPTVVILAGNNKSSIRALVAGRHLRNKGYDIMVCLVGIERERDLLEELRRQVQLYRSFGGKVLKKHDFFEQLRKTTSAGGAATGTGSNGTGRVSVSLIIDALLGLTMSFEELRIGDQATVYELMEWANRNEAFVLSIDVPSGIDPSTGKVAIIDGSPLFVKPRYVVAVGAPKRGLVEAVMPRDEDDPLATSGGVAQDDEWRLYIVDMGLGHTVWRKAGTKVRKGIDFDGKWVLEMKYRGPDEESDDY